jgi:exo-1,4-beta-D-glucosaminidase
MNRAALAAPLLLLAPALAGVPASPAAETPPAPPAPILLRDGWQLQSSVLAKEEGAAVSAAGFDASGWHPVTVPTTVLHALVKRGVYPDVRFALNAFLVPDASDEFNKKENLSRYSHLPDHRNPWTDPWWYRTTFMLPGPPAGTRTWLHFDSIN